jgi:HPt (histidine-containing phosphotransfer) domain-containing protein
VQRAFDQAELLERVDNDWDFLAETVQMLRDDGPTLLEEIRRSTAANDAAAVGRAGHALKGMISNFCASQTHAAAFAIEKIGKSGDLAQAPVAIETLEQSLQTLIADLTDFLTKKA